MSGSRSPLIVIGMHRSGTTLLSQLLQRLGFFMGARQNRNAEAVFANAVNEWLFRQASATWDRPQGMEDLLADQRLRPWLIDYIGGIMRQPAALGFLGAARFLRYRSLFDILEPWGFKDPRTTYTLDYWLELFPHARVVHIVRHGVDVATSLRARRQAVVSSNLERYRRRRRLYLARPGAPKRRGFGPQPRCHTLAGAFDLWEEYVARGRCHVESLGERALEIRYEGLLRAPREELSRVLTLAGTGVDEARVENASRGLDPARAHAWQQDPVAVDFASSVTARLERWGYRGRPE